MSLVIAWRTIKLIDGGLRGLQAYTFFLRFLHFFKIQKTWLFTFFCRVSYVFSNNARDTSQAQYVCAKIEVHYDS